MLDKERDLLEMSDIPPPNDPSIRKHEHFGKLFDATPVPEHVEGFELKDGDDVRTVWPEGTDVAKEVNISMRHHCAPAEDSCLTGSCIPKRGRSNSRSSHHSARELRRTTRSRVYPNIRLVVISSTVTIRHD